MTNIYEIYTTNQNGTIKGWDIKWVRCKPEHIEIFPLFDCVITVNDYPMSDDGTNIIDWNGKSL